MPADDALGPEQDQVPAPVRAEGADYDPEELIADAEARPLPGRSGQYRELMAQQEILGHQRLAVAHGRMEKAEQQNEVLKRHPTSCRSTPAVVPADFCTPTTGDRDGCRWTRWTTYRPHQAQTRA